MINDHFRSLVVQHVSLDTVGQFQRQVIHEGSVRKQVFLHVPTTGNRPDGQQLLVGTTAELVAGIHTGVEVQGIAVVIGVSHGKISGCQIGLGIADNRFIQGKPCCITGVLV